MIHWHNTREMYEWSGVTIDAFDGEYEFLSNFYSSPFAASVFGLSPLAPVFGGEVRFETVEHWFQALKAITPSDFGYIASCPTPGAAKRAGRTIRIRGDWEDVKDAVMERGLRAKFWPGSELSLRLLETGDALLIEGNSWGDRVWGCEIVPASSAYAHGSPPQKVWYGENRLGVALMRLREELAAG